MKNLPLALALVAGILAASYGASRLMVGTEQYIEAKVKAQPIKIAGTE